MKRGLPATMLLKATKYGLREPNDVCAHRIEPLMKLMLLIQ